MKILTVGTSPYLLTSLGKINSDLLCFLKQEYEIKSAVWYLDTSWFLPSEDKQYKYEKDDEIICDIFPLFRNTERSTSQLYEIILSYKPDIIVSICDYNDLSPIYAIKQLDSSMFKWINISIIDNIPINYKYNDAFMLADCNVATSKIVAANIEKITNEKCHYIAYGPNQEIFSEEIVKNNEFRCMTTSKNIQNSNLASIISVSSLFSDVDFYIHTNHSDLGEIDLKNLINRYNCGNRVFLPNDFVSLNDGVSQRKMVNNYKISDVIIDVSIGSSTGLSLLEGMKCGCIPIISESIALKEIVSLLPERYRFIVDSNLYIGDLEEEFYIISQKDLYNKISKIKQIKENSREEFENIRSICIEVANKFDNKEFINKNNILLKDLINKERTIKVETVI